MFETIYNILIHTPTYVYVLFGYLIYVSVGASQDRIVSLKKSMILPIVFSYMSIKTVSSTFILDRSVLSFCFISLLIGIVLGWLQVYNWNIKVDKIKKLMFLPGSWSTLFLVLIIFTAKYYFGFKSHVDPQIFQNGLFKFLALFIYGATSGLFIGKLCNYFYRFISDKHTDLSKSKEAQ